MTKRAACRHLLTEMADDIPFDKNLNLAPDTVDEVMPGVRRVMADNPGPFTFKGTLSYIVAKAKSPSSIRAPLMSATSPRCLTPCATRR